MTPFPFPGDGSGKSVPLSGSNSATGRYQANSPFYVTCERWFHHSTLVSSDGSPSNLPIVEIRIPRGNGSEISDRVLWRKR